MEFIYDYSRLRGDIKAVFGSEKLFAKKMGFKNQNSLSDRFSGKVKWRQNEMLKACDLLNKPLSAVQDYFFTYLVRK